MLGVYAKKKLLKLALKNYLGKPKMNNSRAIIHTATSRGFKALHVPAVPVKPFTAGRVPTLLSTFAMFSSH